MKLSETTNRQIQEVAGEKGCRVLAVETAGAGRYSVLRVVLERTDGESASIDDCEAVSRQVSAILDSTDEVPHRYSLEVSSAGLDRKLYSVDDAHRFAGSAVRVNTHDPVIPEIAQGRRAGAGTSPARNFRGILTKVDADRLTVVDEVEGKIYNVRFGNIRVARLDFSWPNR